MAKTDKPVTQITVGATVVVPHPITGQVSSRIVKKVLVHPVNGVTLFYTDNGPPDYRQASDQITVVT